MRSRPKLKTLLRPGVVAPGQALDVEVILTSASETPIDAVTVKLFGEERVQAYKYYRAQRLFTLVGNHGARTLGVGEHRLSTRFEVPTPLPPSLSAGAISVVYAVDVHVAIPWWIDRRGSYVVPVQIAPFEYGPRPFTVVSSLVGPRGDEPYLEASYDSTTLEPGGVLAGAVSLSNLGGKTIRGVYLCLVVEESELGVAVRRESSLVRWPLREAPIGEDAIPFRVALPAGLPVSYAGAITQLRYFLEIVADVAWGLDAKLRTLAVVVPARGPSRARAGAPRWVAPVGRARRAQVWTAVAAERGLSCDAPGERMSTTVGDVHVIIEASDKGRGAAPLHASLQWPTIGLGLHVTPRTWTSHLTTRAVDFGDDPAAASLTVRAREAAQALAFLRGGVLARLSSFDEASVDDDGARLASQGSAQMRGTLDAFVGSCLAMASDFVAASARVPPPAAMAAGASAWSAFAARIGGRLDVGSMSIRGGAFGAQEVAIETMWSSTGEIDGTRLRVALSPPLEREVDVQSPDFSQEGRDLVAAIRRDARQLRLGPAALEALVDGPLDDPAVVEPTLDGLARLAHALRGLRQAGPFR